MGPLPDADELKRGGSEEADESWWRRADATLRPRLLRYFQAHAFAREDAEDLVQKTLARVFVGVGNLRASDRFLPWLFAIARNVRRTAQRQFGERRRMFGGPEGAEPVAAPRLNDLDELETQRLAALSQAIEGLPPQQRQCLLLRLREERSYEEIARTLRLSLHTVRNHLAEARRNLRQALAIDAQDGEDSP